MVEKVKVINRSDSKVGFPVPDQMIGLNRNFEIGEDKVLDVEELKKVSWTTGGKYILKHYLLITDEEVVNELIGDVEPEYYYTLDMVKDLVLDGSLDQLLDALEFGPDGVIELIKRYAIDYEVADINKRNAIFERTGLNINQAIIIKKEYENDFDDIKVEKKERRANPVTEKTTTTTRRTAGMPVSK